MAKSSLDFEYEFFTRQSLVITLPPKSQTNKGIKGLGNSLGKNGLGKGLDTIKSNPPTTNGLGTGLGRYWLKGETPPIITLFNVSPINI
jgi:hypothetical protein